MPLVISVIICTHNPRPDYLERVLDALRYQTLSINEWELLVIDNASKDVVAALFNVSWHPNGRHLQESTLGLTAARLRGVSEARAEIVVFVDDDNVLDPDYLARVFQIAGEYPFLGAWGGTIRPEFEVEPPAWAKPHVGMLALLEVNRDMWSNLIDQVTTVPWGAGLAVRSDVARAYAAHCQTSDIRCGLDRKGNSLISAGDCDLALTACDLGLGTGRFQRLMVTHLIPSNRVQFDYLVRLAEDSTYSYEILCSLRKKSGCQPARPPRIVQRLVLAYYRLRLSREERAFHDARLRGRARAQEVLATVERCASGS